MPWYISIWFLFPFWKHEGIFLQYSLWSLVELLVVKLRRWVSPLWLVPLELWTLRVLFCLCVFRSYCETGIDSFNLSSVLSVLTKLVWVHYTCIVLEIILYFCGLYTKLGDFLFPCIHFRFPPCLHAFFIFLFF